MFCDLPRLRHIPRTQRPLLPQPEATSTLHAPTDAHMCRSKVANQRLSLKLSFKRLPSNQGIWDGSSSTHSIHVPFCSPAVFVDRSVDLVGGSRHFTYIKNQLQNVQIGNNPISWVNIKLNLKPPGDVGMRCDCVFLSLFWQAGTSSGLPEQVDLLEISEASVAPIPRISLLIGWCALRQK